LATKTAICHWVTVFTREGAVSRPAISQETCCFQNAPRGEKIDKLKEISYITIFTALALGLGYMFSYVPNFKLVPSTVSMTGILFDLRTGTLVGILAYFIFGLLNPLGMSPPTSIPGISTHRNIHRIMWRTLL
jgi:hypothetical protein